MKFDVPVLEIEMTVKQVMVGAGFLYNGKKYLKVGSTELWSTGSWDHIALGEDGQIIRVPGTGVVRLVNLTITSNKV